MKYRIRFFILSIVFLPCFFLYLPAETGSPFIRNYSPKEYNAHSQNWAVIQDKRGVMYFGNVEGLLEFDGLNWRLIKLPNFSMVRSLAIDHSGTIYVGGVGELGFLAPNQDGEISYFSLLPLLPPNVPPPADIWSILVTNHGIYFKTISNFLRFHNGKIVIIPSISRALGFAVKDRVFFPGDGLYVLEDNTARRLPHTEPLDLHLTEQLFVLPYPGSQLLIASRKKGLFLYNLGMLESAGSLRFDTAVPPSILKKFPSQVEDYIRENQLYLCRQISPDRLALSTFNGGIVIMDLQGKWMRLIDKKHGLVGNRVHDIFSDRQQNLWAVLNNGISHIELNSPISVFNERNDLEGTVMALHRFNGSLYAATPHGLFCLRDHPMDPPGKHTAFTRVKNIQCCCWALTETQGILLAGGLFGVRQVVETTASDSFYTELVYSFGKTPRFPHHLFLGLRNGLEALEFNPAGAKRKKEIKVVRTTRFKNIDVDIRRITTDPAGNLWLMTQYSGLWYLKYTGSGLSDYRLYRFGLPQGLPRLDWDWVQCLEDKILVCTQSGLYEAKLPGGWDFDPAALRFMPGKTFPGLPGSGSFPTGPIAVGPGGNIWLRVGDTLALGVGKKGGEYFFQRDHFRKIGGDIVSILPQENGGTWIATNDALYHIDKGPGRNPRADYRVLLRKVMLRSGKVLANDPSLWTAQQQTLPTPVLEFKDNSLSFGFAAAFYEQPESNRYSWFLEGFDKKWTPWSRENKAVYTNLSEGNYRFKVRSRNIYHQESDTAVFRFTVAPPWFRTTLAYVLYGTGLILLLAAAYIGHKVKIKQAILQERKKYEKCFLDPDLADTYTKQLLRFMETHKPYLDPNLSLASLAKAVGIQHHYISQVLNINLEKNFWDFIKEYRIAEARKILADPAQDQLSILEVAINVGFNSSSTFNLAFKKITGITPSAYKASRKVEKG